VDSPVQVSLDPFRAEKIERKLRKSIAFARVRRKRGRERVKFFFLLLGFERRRSSKRERERRGPQKRDKKRRKKKFELEQRGRVFVGNIERRRRKINREWRPTGPTRRAKAGNGGRGKATRTFLSGKY
jgi:hypothetical protein